MYMTRAPHHLSSVTQKIIIYMTNVMMLKMSSVR